MARGGVSAKTWALILGTALMSVTAAHAAALAAEAGHDQALESHERRLTSLELKHDAMLKAVSELVGELRAQREHR